MVMNLRFILFLTNKRRSIKVWSSLKDLRISWIDFYKGSYNKYPEYTAETINSKRTLFVPENSVEINRFQYYIDDLDIGNLKNALFNYPKYVRQESVSVGEEYTDGTRLMTVNKDNYLISYINPAQKSKLFGSSSDLLQKSIDFINDNAGWEDNNYRFAYMSENEQRVVFRLFVNGYPAFNESGMTEIEQIWGKEEIYSYERPYFSLASVLPSEGSVKTLPNGREVLNQLKSKENIDFKSVEDISVGYKLNKSLDSKLVTLVTLDPTWYYRIGDKWFIVPFDEDSEAIKVDWNNTKSIFIMVFFILNIFLLYQFLEKINDYPITKVLRSPLTEELLKEDEISIEAPLPKQKVKDQFLIAKSKNFEKKDLQYLKNQKAKIIDDKNLVGTFKTPVSMNDKIQAADVEIFLKEYILNGNDYRFWSYDRNQPDHHLLSSGR